MVRALWLLSKRNGESVRSSELSSHVSLNCDFSKLRFWGLIKAGIKSNTWAITTKGLSFLMGRTQIDKYVFVFNNKTWPQPEDSNVEQEQLYWYDLVKIDGPTLESVMNDSTVLDLNK